MHHARGQRGRQERRGLGPPRGLGHTGTTLYFAYGSLQRGFSNHEAFAADLGEPVGRFKTVERYPLVVPREAGCTNPGCRFVHRMGALLLDEGEGHQVEGEVYELAHRSFERLDTLERAYLRRTVRVEPLDGGEPVDAHAYFVTAPQPWRDLLASGKADLIARYTPDLAEGPLKPCCVESPGHEGPHDVISPFG